VIASIDRSSPIPIYQQIKQILLTEIDRSEPSATSVPLTERELVERFKVSRAPVRQALKELADEGYFYRERAKGTFPVRRIQMNPPALGGFTRQLEEQGVPFESKVSEAKRLRPPAYVRDRLSLGIDDEVFSIIRRISVEGSPLSWLHIYLIVPDEFNPTAEELEASGSVFRLMGQHPEYALTQGEHSIWAAAASEEDAAALGVAVKDPVLVMETMMYTREGRLGAYRRVVHRAEDYKFVFTVSQ
jgi:GntR family transcriptional regulator